MINNIVITGIFFFITLWTISPVQALVVLVHGAFAQNKAWHKPGGNFFEALAVQAKKENHNIVSFSWSGMPFKHDIIKAAQQLALFIASYPNKEENIILVGHSHGGNVIMKASQLIYDPIGYETDQSSSHKQTLDIILTARTRALITSMHERKKLRINRAFILGTPIDTKHFMPSMYTIQSLCLLYSKNDWVQKVAGFYKRTLPTHDQRINLKTTINNYAPGHSKLHHPVIATWLLNIPERLQQVATGNFSAFRWGTDGCINFYEDKPPEYMTS